MNRLTAYRTFGMASYTPAKGVRLMDSKWYVVRFQNVERDPRTDYIGLAEGEYTELLRGSAARRARDAHLNHCNGIAEHKGPVYQLAVWELGNGPRPAKMYGIPQYYNSEGEARTGATRFEREGVGYIAKCLEQAAKYEAYNPEKFIRDAKATGVGIALVDDSQAIAEAVEMHHKWGRGSRAAAFKYTSSWEIRRVR